MIFDGSPQEAIATKAKAHDLVLEGGSPQRPPVDVEGEMEITTRQRLQIGTKST